MKLVFKSGAEISFLNDLGIGMITAKYPDLSGVAIDVEKCTVDNCRSIRIEDNNGSVIGEYVGLVFDGVDIETDEETGIVTAHFRFHEKTDLEKISERLTSTEDQITEIQLVLADIAE